MDDLILPTTLLPADVEVTTVLTSLLDVATEVSDVAAEFATTPAAAASLLSNTPAGELVLRIVGVVLLGLLCLVGGFANAVVLLVFVRRPALRNRSNRFVMNLLAINLASCFLLLPLASAHLLVSSPALCAAGEAVSAGICASSALGVLLIAADQYRAVLRPLQYHATRSVSSKHFATAFMVATWLGGILCALLSLVDFGSSSALWASSQSFEPILSLRINFRGYFSVFYFLLILCVPVATLCWLYGCIYKEAHKNSKRARRNGSTHECTESNAVNIQPLLVTPQANRIVSSLKHRISNASLFKYREEARAARISFLVIFMSVICWSPYCVSLVLRTLFRIPLPQYIVTASIALLSCTCLVSPALFAYRSRRLQREVKRLVLCKSNQSTLPARNFLTRNKWRKRAALAAVAAATLVNTPEKPEIENPCSTIAGCSLVNPADTSRSSFSSGTTQGTNSTDIE
ncbi:hypothetical protein B566_EDAN015282 [Ephemera danica]|nr:hypothetical protein B566_EDAN015282 [Ephemera danica]